MHILTYNCIKGNDGTTCDRYELGEFVGIVQRLSDMHKSGFVHGDIRLANMVFSEDAKSYLIDIDFVGKHNHSYYSSTFNDELDERHTGAKPNRVMMMEHDRHALEYIMRAHVLPESEKKTASFQSY